MEAGCGCASIRLREPAIAPRTEGQLQVSVRIKEEGQHLQFPIRIYSNDPLSPVTVCTIRAAAAPPPLRTEPAEIDFGQVPLGSAPIKRLKLLTPGGLPWPASEPIRSVSARGLAHIDISRPQPQEQGDGLALTISLGSDLAVGSFSDTLTIRPSGSQRGLQIPVQGNVVPRFILSPNGVYFGEVGPESGALKRYVLIRRTDGNRLNRIVRSAGPPGIKLTEVMSDGKTAPPDRARLLITLDSSVLTQDVHDGKLLLWLENEPDPLMIRVMVFFAKGPAS
jgi:hypothetical protein